MVRVKVLPSPGWLSSVDRAAEQARQLARDRKAEPGAAVLAADGAVGLAEGLEDRLLLLVGDADAGVGHGQARSGRRRRGAIDSVHAALSR